MPTERNQEESIAVSSASSSATQEDLPGAGTGDTQVWLRRCPVSANTELDIGLAVLVEPYGTSASAV